MSKLMRLGALILGLLLALGGVTTAQAAGYTANITTAYPQLTINPSATQVNWVASTAACTVPSRYNVCDDGESDIMSIGFNFTFAGTVYNKWSMSTNGVIFFETAAVGGTSTGNTTYTPVALPTTTFGGVLGPPSTVKAALMPFWADLQKNASVAGANNVGQPANASFFQYEVQTVSGVQVLVVQLKNVKYWNSTPITYVNLQVQLWATGEIVYSYGAMQVMTSNPLLRIGLQFPGAVGGCNNLANTQSTSLSNQSYLYTWDAAAAACQTLPTVNHYEIREDGAATLCAEPVTVLACSSATSPCPAASIINTQIINAAVTVTGTGSLATPTISPPSLNILPSAPLQTVNLTWASGTSGTATLGLSPALNATGALKCTNVAGTSTYANCNMTVANTACIAPPNHYQITGPATGSTCANNTFTIKAWADAAETTAYTAGAATGTLTQTGNPASLPSLGAFSIPAGSSTVSITPITFPATGTTTFNTTASPALAGATTCNFGGSTSCAFVASSATCVADFNCTETVANAAVAADSDSDTGRTYTKLAGTAFTFDVMARKSDKSTATYYLSDSGQSVTVSLVDGSSGVGATCTPAALSPAGPASQTLTFVAGDSGRKSITFTAPKAYPSVRCYAVDTNATVTKGCSQDNFAIRPPGITLATSASAAPPPSATAATNTPTVMAGASFTLQASTSTSTNYTGTLTLDTNKLTAQTTAQVATLQSGGAVGALTPTTLATNPATQPTNNATYGEVGYLYLAAGTYYDNAASAFTAVDVRISPLSSDCVAGSFSDTPVSGKIGCNIGTAAAAFGRFIPDHFDTAIVQATAPIGCPAGMICPTNCPAYAPATCPTVPLGPGGLVYSNQPFTVKVTAKNTAGGTATNYQNKFAKATTLSAWNANGGATANPGAGTMAGTAVAAASFANGVVSTVAASYGTALPTLLAPTDVFFRAAEAAGGDGVTSLQTTSIEAGLKIASGRIRIPNAYGSERLALPLPISVQYYNGASWVTSTTDSTMTFDSALTPVGNLTATMVTGPANCVSVNAPAAAAVASGVRTISLMAAAVCSYSISLIGTPTYLPIATATGGRATFGVFKSPLIYRRENY
jgi:hypothetical protein